MYMLSYNDGKKTIQYWTESKDVQCWKHSLSAPFQVDFPLPLWNTIKCSFQNAENASQNLLLNTILSLTHSRILTKSSLHGVGIKKHNGVYCGCCYNVQKIPLYISPSMTELSHFWVQNRKKCRYIKNTQPCKKWKLRS